VSKQFNSLHEQQYAYFENAIGLPINSVPLALLGEIAFENLRSKFPSSDCLNVCDVGCYLGSTSLRWAQHGNDIQVLGTDIYESNITHAVDKYQHVHNLQFKHMQRGHAIPLLNGQKYHAVFATFVIDTIHDYDDVEQLCRNMVDALVDHGEIYLLRLHPNSLRSQAGFQEYELPKKSTWTHGDELLVQLTKENGKKMVIEDRYWDPNHISKLFRQSGCQVNLIEVSLKDSSPIQGKLMQHLHQVGIASDLPEWTIPLYQFIRVQNRRHKNHDS